MPFLPHGTSFGRLFFFFSVRFRAIMSLRFVVFCNWTQQLLGACWLCLQRSWLALVWKPITPAAITTSPLRLLYPHAQRGLQQATTERKKKPMNASQTVKLSIHVPGNSHLHWAPRGEQGSALLKIHAMVLQYLPNPLIKYIVQHKLCSGFAQDKQYPAPPTSRSTLPVSSPLCVDSRNWESNCYPKTPRYVSARVLERSVLRFSLQYISSSYQVPFFL